MKPETFIASLTLNGINTCYGVPDSLLKNFCAYISDYKETIENVITANEGNAIGMACGHYLATGRPALVYMQNSGQGNCINPLLSLMDEDVYNIPVLLLIGWRGEPGIKDEPQHVKQGKTTLTLLETVGIKYDILSSTDSEAIEQIQTACRYMQETNKPYAIIARKNTFSTYTKKKEPIFESELSREEAIHTIANKVPKDSLFISTTGQISRELYEYRKLNQLPHGSDFLTVGGMGHASSIALAIAMKRPERQVICLDGDGAFLMHMGAAAIIGTTNIPNFHHIILNNSAHDSVGAQPTVAGKINIELIATGCNYKSFFTATTKNELTQVLPQFINSAGPTLLEVKVRCGARPDLGRPKEQPTDNKNAFMATAEMGQAHVYPGAISQLKNIVTRNKWKKVLCFSTKTRIAKNKAILESLSEICAIDFYTKISPNPEAKSVAQAQKDIQKQYDAIMALGGGSVIDFAKLYRAATDNKLNLEDYFLKPSVLIRKTPLIAIPTTAGTGSEATRFAVIYINGEKKSLDATAVMPDYALADSHMLADSPKQLKASCGMDTLAQAMEGYWAKGATADSDKYALEAIQLCRENLVDFVCTNSATAHDNMMRASHLAGKCINIARTTAAHALSYKFTQLYGIPHGHAVALSLPGLSELHYQKASEGSILKDKMHNLLQLLQITPTNIRGWFHEIYKQIDLEYKLHNLKIIDLDSIINGVNTERLSNNPLNLTKADLRKLF